MEDPRGKRVFEPLFRQMIAQMRATFSGDDGPEVSEMEMMGFLKEMPLLDVLDFQEGTLPASPDEMVDGLLAQVYNASK
jgi:beta-glucosidase